MKKSFIRAVWGDITSDGIRGGKLRRDIDLIKNNKFTEPFVIYVFGKENYRQLTLENFDCRLINDSPVVWDMKTELYRHKLQVFVEAMQDFNEIVFLDWDCRPTAKLPEDFWTRMKKKAPFQANLFQYRTKKCLWRSVDWRKVCNGGFIYIRDHDIPEEILQNYYDFQKWAKKKEKERKARNLELRFREKALMFDDEPAMSKWVDDYMGGWKGKEEYWKLFEPDFCNLKKKSAFEDELLKTKEECFVHFL